MKRKAKRYESAIFIVEVFCKKNIKNILNVSQSGSGSMGGSVTLEVFGVELQFVGFSEVL